MNSKLNMFFTFMRPTSLLLKTRSVRSVSLFYFSFFFEIVPNKCMIYIFMQCAVCQYKGLFLSVHLPVHSSQLEWQNCVCAPHLFGVPFICWHFSCIPPLCTWPQLQHTALYRRVVIFCCCLILHDEVVRQKPYSQPSRLAYQYTS